MRSPAGHAALIHAIAHIEFNAINLALDAVYRFRGMPLDYYADWLQVAEEEAYHFSLLRAHLVSLGHDYGDFEAHDGLWQMAQRTAAEVLYRLVGALRPGGLLVLGPVELPLAAALPLEWVEDGGATVLRKAPV